MMASDEEELNPSCYDEKKSRMASVKLLYKCFCNNLVLGQWEVARSCIKQLHDEAELIDCNISDILIEITESPYKQSLGSSTLTTPSQLSWLCLLECHQIITDSQKVSFLLKLSKDAGFRLLLAELPPDTESFIIKELYEFFQKIYDFSPNIVTQTPTTPTLSKNTLSFLKHLLMAKTDLAHLLITYLIQHGDSTSSRDIDFTKYSSSVRGDNKTRSNEALQGLYIQCINLVLDHLDKTTIKQTEKSEQFSKLLGYYDPEAYWNYVQLRQLFTRLIESSEKEDFPISKNRIVSLLMGRESSYLIDEYCKLEYELILSRSVNKTDTTIAKLPEEQKCILNIWCSNEDSQTRWRNTFILSVKKKHHFLEMILSTALELIKAEKFCVLETFLDSDDLAPLKPMILLLGWSYCSSCNIARQLLSVLWNDNDVCTHTVLTSSCKKLSYQIDLIQWCLDKAKPLIESSSTVTTMASAHERATNMLQNLSTHSVLFVLHQSTRISALNQDEVLRLLQNTSHSDSKNKKSVRFNDQKSKSMSGDSQQPISIEQHCDISTFRSYCALKNVMDILSFSAEYFEHALMNPVCVKSTLRPKHLTRIFSPEEGVSSSSDGEDWLLASQTSQRSPFFKSDDAQNFEKIFETNVTKKLLATRNHLQQLHPLTLRVETMENIFSLLFVMHEDFNSDYVNDYDSAEEEGEVSSKLNSAENTSLLSDDDTPPTESLFKFQRSDSLNRKSQNASSKKSIKSCIKYDEPFEDPKKTTQISQSLNQKSSDFASLQTESKPTPPNKKLSLTLTTLRKISTANRSSDFNSSINSNNIKIGFLANEYIVRDTLAMLKDSLADLNSTRFKLNGKDNKSASSTVELSVSPATETLLTDHIKSSITTDTIQPRITKLTQLIHEAQWRYQLVCHESIPRQTGVLLDKQIITSDSDVSVLLTNSHRRDSKTLKPDKKGSTEEEVVKNNKVKVGSRSQCSSLFTLQYQSLGIIPYMLSTPDTLLSMCLSKANFGQASQVIKLFKLEKKDETAEVQFSEAYKQSADKICSLVDNSGKSSTSSSRPGKLSLKALGNVAAAGMASASLTNITDDLLTMTTIPMLPKPNLPKSHKMTNLFTDLNVSSVILMDLMLTSCQTWDLCNKMFDVIKSKMNVKLLTDGEISNQSSEIPVKGCLRYLSELQKVLEIGSDHQVAYNETSDTKPSTLLKQSFVSMLATVNTPMSAHKLKNYTGIREEIRLAIERVQTELKLVASAENSILEDSTSSISTSSSRPSPEGSFSSRGSIRTDTSMLHNVMKQLIRYMEKYLPHGGMIRFINKTGSAMVFTNRNYLLSLYEHVKELAFLVAQSESKSQETLVFPQNYFRTLQEGPILILGRLMFNKKLQPEKLEKVAAKLSLNLTHIIVHSCCPRIPSKHIVPVLSSAHQDIEGTKMLYNGGVCDNYAKDPGIFIATTLASVLHKLKDMAVKCNAKEIFDITCGKLMVQDDQYNSLFIDSKQLQQIDLSRLKTKDEKTSFFINLQNLMTIHMNLNFIYYRLQKQKLLESEETRTALLPDKDVFCMSSLDHLVYRQQFSYHVGQLGVISLYELKAMVCGQKCLPSLQINHIAIPSYNLIIDDNWCIYGPPQDDRLIFLQTDCCISSPYLQVINSESLSNQLQITMKEYINNTVSVDLDNKQVTVSQFLMWFKDSRCQPGRSKSTYSMFKELIDLILNYLDGTKRSDLQELINLDVNDQGSTENIDTAGRKELPYKVQVQPFNPEFGIVFSALCLPSSDTVVIPRSKPHAVNRMESSIESLLERSGSFIENPSYLLTPTTLDYIKSDSLLVATMVSLVCADELDEIDQHFTDDYFRQESIPRGRTMSDISLVDIRSYRYQRLTDDFPILQRHLLNYILPIAGADNPDISNSGDPILKFVTNDIDDKVKLCMFSLHNSLQFQDVVNDLIDKFLQKENYLSVLTMLRSIPEIVIKQKLDWQILHDFCITSVTILESQGANCDMKVMDLLRYFYSADTQVRTILSVCNNVPVETGIDLLEMCLTLNLSADLMPLIEKQIQILNVYAKIIDSVKNLQFKLSMQTSEFISMESQDSLKTFHSALAPFTDWHYLVKTSQTSPKDVLAVLMKTGIYITAKEWGKINNIAESLQLDIEERYLVSLLTSESSTPPNVIKAFQVLESLRKLDSKICYNMCENLLQKLPDHRHILFLTSYMLNHLASDLKDNRQDLHLRHIGAKALQCLPSSLRPDYSSLITTPHLILEQLLMNMKADLAGQVFSKIKKEFVTLTDDKLRLTNDEFNEMLTKYSKLAIEVVVVLQTVPDRDRSQSVESTDQKKEESEIQKSFMDSVKVRRRGFDHSVSPRNPMVPSPSASPRRRSSAYLRPQLDTISSSVVSANSLSSNQSKFIMPAVPPPPDKWVPDASASVCMVCKVERFSMFSRRHHCRRCGRVVCAACSTKRTLVQGVSARVCDDCYSQIFGPVNAKPKEPEFYSKTPDRLSEASLSPPRFSSSFNSVTSPDSGENLNITLAGESEWKLKIDESYNNNVREEFFYEQAPSVSLSISILNHHSNGRECGHVLLKICDDLSKYLKPISPGVPNPEVDYNLIISMIKQLLFQAKMKFLTLGDNNGVAQCDMYQTRVDLLKILVESNYRNLPTIEELTKVDTVRRLRDELISDERLGLAMEVSTKCGIDPHGVWAAWGMASLHCGDYIGAREKFSHCLKPPKDKNQTVPSSRLLQEVVDHLETLPATGATEIQMLLSSPASIKSLINMPASTSVEESSMETKQFQECLFYIKTYGTYLELLHLLRRNGYWMKAAEYISQHKCSGDVFIDGLLEPALCAGDLDKLLDQMVMLDKSLEKWNSFLTTTCRYLLKQRLHHALYQIQIFMKDFLRAAMTCITHFYQQGCQSYLDLNKHINYLFLAQQHMQAYLDPSKWGSVKHPFNSPSYKKGVDWSRSSTDNPVRLSLTPDEVNKHIRTIALQIEVTQYLDQCLKRNEGNSTTLAAGYVVESQKSHLPTLFGNSKSRTDLVTMILQSGKNIQSGFQLSTRIINECHLSSTAIFSHTCRELAKQQHYNSIRELYDLIQTQGIGDDESRDEIIRAALLILADNQEEAKETENLIKLLKKDTNKINAYILCGKLRSAYLLAVKGERVEDVQRIAGAAQRTGQNAVKNICTKWLQQRKK